MRLVAVAGNSCLTIRSLIVLLTIILNNIVWGSLGPFSTSREHGKPKNSKTKIYFSNRQS